MMDQSPTALPTRRKARSYSSLKIWLEITNTELQMLKYVEGSSSFEFTAYFSDNYPFEAPKIFLTRSSLSDMRTVLPIEPHSKMVRLNMLEADWSPVLSLSLIVLMLQQMIKFPQPEVHNQVTECRNAIELQSLLLSKKNNAEPEERLNEEDYATLASKRKQI